MRKFHIILVAVATLLAGAACSKVVPTAEGPADEAVTFEVASFMHRTKANVAFDTGKTFTTYSWYYSPDEEEVQPFMNPATIQYFEGINVWKATRPYYWPKTGYINFISFAQEPVPTSVEVQELEGRGSAIVVSYGAFPQLTQDQPSDPVYVEIDDAADPMLANAAYRYSWNKAEEWDPDVVVDTPQGSDPGIRGIPTLFHHLVSKVTIMIRFDASNAAAGHSWKLDVNRASFNCATRGILQAWFEDPGVNGLSWPDGEGFLWFPELDEDQAIVLVDKEADSQSATYAPGQTTDPIVLWDGVSVLPQDLDSGQTLALNLTLTNTYQGGSPLVETFDLPIAFYQEPNTQADQPYSFGSELGAWEMGHHYVYTITIMPNASVNFDPATVDWEVSEIDYPF